MLDCLGKTLFLMLYQNQSVPRAGIHGVHRLAGHLHVALEGVRRGGLVENDFAVTHLKGNRILEIWHTEALGHGFDGAT